VQAIKVIPVHLSQRLELNVNRHVRDRNIRETRLNSIENQHHLTKFFSILTGFEAVYVQRNYRDRLNSSVDGNQSNNKVFRGFSSKIGLLYKWNEQCMQGMPYCKQELSAAFF
jgi:hypothetical protein